MKYFTSDTHFGHTNVIKYENRPFETVEEMDEALIKNWNQKVKANDEVYILGDFSFYKAEKTMDILKRLNGKKYLIRGNHDYYLDDKNFDKTLFESINDYLSIKDNKNIICMFHYPIAVWDRMHYGSIHLYGHIHSKMELVDYKEKLAFNVGCDVNNYEPITLDELIKKK